MHPPRHGEGDRPKGGGGGVATASAALSSVAAATAISPSRGGAGRIALASVAGAHGVKGEVRLKLFTDGAASLRRHEHVFVGGIDRELETLRDASGGAIARFSGVGDRSAAESLRGSLVEVERSALPPLEEGEYYHADLVGIACVDGDGAAVGSVVGVENFGAGDLLEVEGPDGRRSLIPLKPGIADLEDGRIVLDREFLA
ncbi:MAG: 16S rRNA processing protein RimM [Sphingomonas sp.]|nr:16S rRNA processing protein RimM [Sphingomonas sp.]